MGGKSPNLQGSHSGRLLKGTLWGLPSLPPSRVGLGSGHLVGYDSGADFSALKLQRPSEGVPELGQLL